ncbi:MAG: tetratricopeptide repeat protein [Sandaracinaceae bacterium]|nr:tetratricopeptide repeat protein [Sandaracinaceae bacterium]
MNATTDILRGELERLFELDELKKLSDELLGLDPETVGGTDGKGAFARALVEACKSDDSLLALADALLLSKDGVDAKVEALFDAQPGEELKAGAEVVGCRILKKLGEGGVGVVYLAEKKADDGEKLRVALKVLRPVHTRDRSAARRFLTVARIHKGLESKSLAPVVDVGTLEDGRLYVVTEFVNGQSLSQRVGRTGPMHYNEVRPIVRGVLDALSLLHARGLVHGDVKTENVFMVRPTSTDKMTNEPTGVLVDGGVDRLFARSPVGATQSGLHPVVGTAKAIAPELARGSRASAATDLYAVGCMLYETLSGRPPFVGDTGIDVVAQHLMKDAEPPSAHAPRGWVAKELDAIVLRSLSKDPKDRYASADAFKEAIESIGRASIPPEAREKKALDEEAFDAATAELLEDPGNEELAVALERIVEPALAWDKAAEVLAMAAEDAETDAKKALFFRIARIREQDLADAAGAEEVYRQILELDGDDDIARAALEELKRSTGDAEGLVELLLEKVEGEESAEERAAILREIAETYESKLSDRENAFVAWVQALAEDPRDQDAIDAVERLAGESTDNWNEAITALNETLGSIEDEAEKPALYVLLGRWYADKLARPDFAIPCFGQALAIDPANDAAMEGTIALYRKAQSWQELVTMLVQRADSTTNPVKARDWRAEAARIVDKRMGDPGAAAAMYESILKEDGAHPAANEALEGIYADRKEWKPLVKLLETKAANQRGDDRLVTLCAIAEIYEDRLGDDDQAAAHYEAALKHDERQVAALKGLERIYSRTDRFPELLANLDKQLEAAATPRQRISLLERAAGIHLEEFMDHEKAEACLAQIVEIEPGHEGANVMLVGVYRKLQRFDDLAKTLERHALGSEDERRKIDLLLQAAKVLMVDVGAPERALGIVERVTSINADHTEALELMSRLQAQTGDAAKALEATDRLAEAESDPAKKADLYVRSGRILEDKGDKDGAIERYKRALDTQPDHPKAATALRAIYSGRGDAHGAAELLAREIEVTEGKISKAKLYAELGSLQRDRLEDPIRARISFEKALELDATSTPAARGLGDMAFDKGDFPEAARYYEPLLARTSEMAADLARDVSVRCGDAFRKLELYDKAQRAYLNAKAFASDDREVLERVAEVTFDMGAPDEAAELYRDVVKQFGKDLVGQEKGRVLWRFGESLRQAGELGEAKLHLNEAADLTPDDPAPLRSLKELYASQGKWEDVVRTLRRRMESAPDDERYTLLVETGDVLMNEIGDKAKASKSYVAALELRADDRNLLTKLMAVYSESKDWSRLVEVILRIAELVDDSRQLSKYYHTAAAICHFELNRLDEAADYYEQALEHEPTSLKSFDGLVTALNGQSDWDRLEEVYRDRIKGLTADTSDKDRAHLHDQLGELLLHRLERPGDATEAFEEAARLDPHNRRRSEQLASIYSAEPKRYFQKAVKVHGDLLQLNPYRIESYQALRKLYTEAKKPDESWCACQALTVLKNAEPDEEGFYKKHRSREPAAATSAFTNELWAKHLVHPTQDGLLTDIFATISRAVIANRAQDLGKFGLSAGDKRKADSDEADLARTLHYAAGVTAIALPDVYYRTKDPGGLSFVFTDPPSIGLGKGALAGGPGKALAFVAGRHLSYLRPGHYLRMLVPTGSGLRSWLLAAIKTAVGQFPIPKNLATPVAENLAAFETHLTGTDKDRLRSHVQKLLAAAPELDLKKWVAAVDLTADRVGFVLSNDLEYSTAMIKASPEESAGVPSKERLKELHIYAVSEEYLTLRHKLGISIGD